MTDVLSEYRVNPESVKTEMAPAPKEEIKTEEPASSQANLSSLADPEVFQYLSGKLNREVKSWNDFIPKEIEKQVEVERSYASDETQAIDQYVRSTGRSVKDYYEMNRNWDEEADDSVIKAYLKKENPFLNSEEIDQLFVNTYGPESIDEEEMDDRMVQKIRKENETREITKKSLAGKSRKFFAAEKEQYGKPVEHRDALKEGEILWKEHMNSALEKSKKLDFEENFSYELPDPGKYAQLADLKGMMNFFKDEGGQVNYEKLARTLLTGLNASGIMEEHRKFIDSRTRESIMEERSNKGDALNKTMSANGADSNAYQERMRKEIMKEPRKY